MLRGERSQVAFSRRLGYRSNVAADWEQGRRAPTAHELLRAAGLVGIEVSAALERFQPGSAVLFAGGVDQASVGAWLDHLRGTRSIRETAEGLERDPQAVWRWVRGRSAPRVPDFLRLVDAFTGRVPQLLVELLGEPPPSLVARHREQLASRSVGLEHPWSLAVLMLLQTPAYRSLPAHDPAVLAEWAGIPVEEVERSLTALEQAGLVGSEGGRRVPTGQLTVDTGGDAGQRARLRAHWTRAALERIAAPRPDDLFSYNVFAVSATDLARIRSLQRAFYREVRAIVAASPETEAVALLNVQCLGLGPQDLTPR